MSDQYSSGFVDLVGPDADLETQSGIARVLPAGRVPGLEPFHPRFSRNDQRTGERDPRGTPARRRAPASVAFARSGIMMARIEFTTDYSAALCDTCFAQVSSRFPISCGGLRPGMRVRLPPRRFHRLR